MPSNRGPVSFLRNGAVVTIDDVPPTRTLLDAIRLQPPAGLGACGTKEGCAEGDCGACTVVIGEPDAAAPDRLRFRAINSCIRLAHSIDGCALWTVEDLRGADGGLHPVQQAMVDAHATQCGFCTPGFVMSLFAAYAQRRVRGEPVGLERDVAAEILSGNLCRCTGYRPIFDAAAALGDYPLADLDEQALLARLKALASPTGPADTDASALRPTTLDRLLELRAAHPDAQIVAGATDVGLWITKHHRHWDRVLDTTGVAELQRVERDADGSLRIGAAVRLTDAFDALVERHPQLRSFAARFAGLPVRNSGTLGGNVANGSPIGDSMPVLLALGARVRLASRSAAREMPLEDFYVGYRRNRIAADEVLTHVIVPPAPPGTELATYKISKRFDDDISAVCLAVRWRIVDGRIVDPRIGVGGMAATPARASATEAALAGADWSLASLEHAAGVLRAEFSPIDDMRATAEYRREVAGNLLRRLWLERQGVTCNLETTGALR